MLCGEYWVVYVGCVVDCIGVECCVVYDCCVEFVFVFGCIYGVVFGVE